MKANPPRLPLRFFRCFCHRDLRDAIEGDLVELYGERVEGIGIRKADWKFAMDVLLLFRPGIIRNMEVYQPKTNYGMYRSYFKIGWRNLVKNKGYAAINVGGLALGLTCFLTIVLFVQHEFSYDRFYPNFDRIYRVYQQQTGNVFLGTDYFAVTPAQLASVIQEEFPEVVHATSVEKTSGLLASGEENIWQDGLAGDAGFFKVFKVSFLMGDPRTALEDGQSIVLTQSLAKSIFGNQNPMGMPIHYQGSEKAFFVTGVIADPPLNSSLKYGFVIHILYNNFYAEEMKRTGWSNNSFYTFFELSHEADPEALEDKFVPLLEKFQSNQDFDDYPFKDKYYIQPITASYFQADVNFDLGQKGNLKVIYAYVAVALIVLLLACINYMNLAVARSVNRTREVGLRKVVGAARKQLIEQFLGESVLISLFSLILAIALCLVFLPYFGQTVDRPIEINFLSDPWLLPGLVVLVLIVGLLSGGYPAVLLSSLKPLDIFKSNSPVKLSGISMSWWIFALAGMSALLVAGFSIGFQSVRVSLANPVDSLRSD